MPAGKMRRGKMESIKDKVAIVGMGCTKFGELWDKGPEDLVIDAAYEAYEDAGIDPKDVQAAWVGTASASPIGLGGLCLAEPLKLPRIPVTRVENYCATGLDALRNACFAVACGVYDIVLVLGFEKLKDTGVGGLGVGRGMHPTLEMRRTAPGTFSLIATRYFHVNGLSMEKGKEVIGKIAVKNHYNGSMHPKAHFQRKVTMEEVVNAPLIAWPLGLYDCCGNSDGGAAAILVRADMARKFRDDPVYIKGIGHSVNPMIPHFEPGFSWTGFEVNRLAAKQAYEQAGIKNPRKELNLACVHDCFTITELVIYEDLGFSPPGKGWEDVEAGTFNLDGELPVNPDGGLKCFGHPVGASGLRMVYENYKQLQEKCGQRQIINAERGLSHTLGGHPSVAEVVIVGNGLG
jgi:acetyl-CoA C-acetyltransferase